MFNAFHDTGLFLYPLKTSENQRFSDVFKRYRKRPIAWNGLKKFRKNVKKSWELVFLLLGYFMRICGRADRDSMSFALRVCLNVTDIKPHPGMKLVPK